MGGLGRCCVAAVPARPEPVPNACRADWRARRSDQRPFVSRKCGGMATRGPCGRALLAAGRPLQRPDSADRRPGDRENSRRLAADRRADHMERGRLRVAGGDGRARPRHGLGDGRNPRALGFAGPVAARSVRRLRGGGIGGAQPCTADRGYAPTGVRGVASVVTPMINVGLDRSMRLAEVLEARGFGGRRSDDRPSSMLHDLGWTALLGGAFVAGYGLIAAIGWAAIGGLVAVGTGAVVLPILRSPNAVRRA